MKNSYSLANAIIMPSRGQISILQSQKVIQKNVYVIPNGVDHHEFSPQSKLMCRQKLNLEKDCFYFCFVGNIASWQGLNNAVIALSMLMREIKNKNVKLIIVGDGPAKKQLEKLLCELHLKDRIIFLGAVPHESVPHIINACDVCIAPFTAWRNKKIGVSPLKLFEYLSCGKPVIASSLLGTEIIENLDAGILVEPDNIEELKEAYKESINKLPCWEKRAHALHEEITRNHSWERRVDDIIEVMYRINRKHGL